MPVDYNGYSTGVQPPTARPLWERQKWLEHHACRLQRLFDRSATTYCQASLGEAKVAGTPCLSTTTAIRQECNHLLPGLSGRDKSGWNTMPVDYNGYSTGVQPPTARPLWERQKWLEHHACRLQRLFDRSATTYCQASLGETKVAGTPCLSTTTAIRQECNHLLPGLPGRGKSGWN